MLQLCSTTRGTRPRGRGSLLAEGVKGEDEDQRDQNEGEKNGEAVVHGGSLASVAAPTAVHHPLHSRRLHHLLHSLRSPLHRLLHPRRIHHPVHLGCWVSHHLTHLRRLHHPLHLRRSLSRHA